MSKQKAKFKVGDTLVIKKMCNNVEIAKLTIGSTFTIDLSPSYFGDNGGLKRHSGEHAFYKYKSYNIPQDAVELADWLEQLNIQDAKKV